MNVDQIIAAVARLHQKTAASLTSDERAVILQGLNDARVFAEREHDFKAAMDYGFALVDPVDGATFRNVMPSTVVGNADDSEVPYVRVLVAQPYSEDVDYEVFEPTATTSLMYVIDTAHQRFLTCAVANGPSSTVVNPNAAITWVSGLAVAEDAVIFNAGSYYVCTLAHTADAASEPGTGVDWEDYYDPAVWVEEASAQRLRDVTFAEVWDDVNEVWVRMDVIDEQTYRARWDGQNSQDDARSFEQPTLVLQGNSFMRIYGVDEEHDPYLVRLYGPFWLAPYVDVEDSCTQTDFLTDHGHDFLMWSAALDANYRWMTWIPRQEGSMPPPENRRERAWAALLDWDNFVHLPRQQNYVR